MNSISKQCNMSRECDLWKLPIARMKKRHLLLLMIEDMECNHMPVETGRL